MVGPILDVLTNHRSWHIEGADALEGLARLPDVSVHTVVTSPPYWAQRRYHAGPQELGSEATSEEYLAKQVAVFRDVRRVLRDDGVLWINCGETYTAGNIAGIPYRLGLALQADGWTWRSTVVWAKPAPMPESVAGWRWEQHQVKVAAQENNNPDELVGRYNIPGAHASRSTPTPATWSPCPGCPKCSANDGLVLRKGSFRATRSHEYLLMLTKGMGYFSDQEAVKEAASEGRDLGILRGRVVADDMVSAHAPSIGKRQAADIDSRTAGSGKRNPRDVQRWTPEPQGVPQYAETPVGIAHYAAFPPALPDWCLRATCPRQVCVRCGAPWAPVVEKARVGSYHNHKGDGMEYGIRQGGKGPAMTWDSGSVLGYKATCSCGAGHGPGLALDPYAGTGTTVLAAVRLGLRAVGIELNPDYARLATSRIISDSPLFNGPGSSAMRRCRKCSRD